MNPKITMVARYLLGLMLLVFGLNKFINFMPALELPPDAATFFGALMDSGYLMYVVGLVEVVVGLLLVVNKYVPLALILYAPITLNIILFHLFLAPAAILFGAIVLILHVFLFYAYRAKYLPLLADSADG